MMAKLKAAVEQLIQQEYALASEQHGQVFHSSHEAYSVILEEKDELSDEINFIDAELCKLWREVNVVDGKSKEQDLLLNRIERYAIKAACEAVQVAAMAHKALQGYGG